MSEQVEAKTNRTQQYSSLLISIANILLLVTLVGVRVSRVRGTNTSFISMEFIVLFGIALGLAGLLFWGLWNGKFHKFIQSIHIILVLIGVAAGFAGIILLPEIAPQFRSYQPPFILWGVLVSIAVLMSAFSTFLSERGQQLFVKIVIVVVSILVPLIMLEVGMRLWFSYFGTEEERIAYIYDMDQILEATNRYVGQPYINYGLSPSHPDHNSRGYRGEEIETPKPEDVFRIVALGGSTTYGDSIPAEYAYPTQLQRILRDEYGFTNVEVLNGGVAAYSSYDSLANLIYHVLDDEPDMIIIYHAVNDVIARLVDPAYYNGGNPVKGTWTPQQLPPSTLLRFIGIASGLIPNPGNLDTIVTNTSDIQRCTLDNRDFCENLNMTPLEVLEVNPPIYFERNLSNIIALAQANDIHVVLSSWAYFPDPTPNGDVMTLQHMQDGVAEHNAITAQLAEEFDLPFYDFFANIPYNIHFWKDGLHLSEAGALEQASEYAEFLVTNDLIPTPDENQE